MSSRASVRDTTLAASRRKPDTCFLDEMEITEAEFKAAKKNQYRCLRKLAGTLVKRASS